MIYTTAKIKITEQSKALIYKIKYDDTNWKAKQNCVSDIKHCIYSISTSYSISKCNFKMTPEIFSPASTTIILFILSLHLMHTDINCFHSLNLNPLFP